MGMPARPTRGGMLRGPRMSMRPVLVVSFLIVATAVASVWWLTREPAIAPPLPPLAAAGQEPAVAPAQPAANEPAKAPRVTAVTIVPPSAANLREPQDLANRVTAWLRIIDSATKAPIATAAVYRFVRIDEAPLGYSDNDGLVPLPLKQTAQLIVVRAGYMMRLAPTEIGSTAELPQVIALEPDRYSQRCGFHFRLPDGSTPAEVLVRFRPQRPDVKELPIPAGVTAGGEALLRAWREQRTLAVVRALPDLHVQAGATNAAMLHVLNGDDDVAFVDPGIFEFEAATTDGFLARGLFDTADVVRSPLTVRMRPGMEIQGRVRGAGGAPVAGALVTVVGSDPLRLQARSNADGTFAIGPLADGAHGIEVRHRDHEVARVGAVVAGSKDVAIAMTPLPDASLRGRIVAGGTRAPIVGARATVLDPTGQPTMVESDLEGFFSLRASGTESLRLNIAADGCLPHAEFVSPGARDLEIELWPRQAEARLQAGLSGVLRGRVTDAQGNGAVGLGVRFTPTIPPADWLPGRRIISAGRTALPMVVQTGSDGSFDLEIAFSGAGSVDTIPPSPSGPITATVVLGRIVGDLRLRAPKR